MSETIIPVSPAVARDALVDAAGYEDMYQRSIADPASFWAEQAKRIDWIKPFSKVKNTSFDPHKVSIKWFEDGTLNVSYNCVDRHAEKTPDKTAIIWEGDDPSEHKLITYRELKEQVSRFANVLKAHGVGRGDRVTIYLPMIPEAAYAMLACARIGAIHSVVFAGFSPDSLAGRIQDCDSPLIITAAAGPRGGRRIPPKATAKKRVHLPVAGPPPPEAGDEELDEAFGGPGAAAEGAAPEARKERDR